MTNYGNQDLPSCNHHHYIAYGLNIRSTLPLPDLHSTSEGKVDLLIEEEKFSLPVLKATAIYRQGREAYFGKRGDSAFLHWENIASFRAEGGKKLSVMKARNDLDEQLLNLYVLSEALGLILHQKGYFLLHGSAVVVNGGVILFIGVPGAGKSTTAGAFTQQGYTVITDDMVALEVTNQVSVTSAFPQLKLWENSVDGLNYDYSQTKPLFEGSHKRVIRHHFNFPYTQKLPLSAIYLLENSSDFNQERLTSQEGVINLTRFFSCPHDLLSGSDLVRHFQQCQVIATQVPIYRLFLPKKFEILGTIVRKLTNSL